MKRFFYLTIILIVAFTSCGKDEVTLTSEQDIKQQEELSMPSFENSTYNLNVKDFAMAINEIVNTNESFKEFIKTEAMKKVDGDFDIVLSQVLDKQISINNANSPASSQKVKANTTTVRDMIEDTFYKLHQDNKLQSLQAKQLITSPSKRQKVKGRYQTFVDELVKEHPNLQISVPVHIKDLEDPNYIPPVTFVPVEAYQKRTKSLIAYKGQETILLDTEREPKNAVIVIGLNERMNLPPLKRIIPPTPKLNVKVTESGIRLLWSVDSYEDISYYRILRKQANSTELEQISLLNAYNTTEYVYDDILIESNKTYTYYVEANNTQGQSSMSAPATIIAPNKPKPVQDFKALLQAQNEVELRWDNDHSQYISSTKLYRRIQHKDTDYKLYKNFTSNDHHFFDRDIKGGDRIYYKITHKNELGESNAKYDFVYMPYRNILEKSPVTLHKITYSWRNKRKKAIENWFQGLPEFQIKVFTVDSKGVPTEIFYTKLEATSTRSFDCNINLHNWQPSNYRWYDVLSFKVIESDVDWGTFDIKVPLKAYGKIGNDTLGASMGLEATYTSPTIKFGNEGDDMGEPVYYSYFDPINYILDFQNFDFKMYLK